MAAVGSAPPAGNRFERFRRCRLRRMEPPEKILVIRLKCIGDVLFTLPAMHALRNAYPKAHLSYLVSAEFAPLLQGFGQVDTTLTLNRSIFRRLNPGRVIPEMLGLWRQLRSSRFSLAIDLQGYGETAFLAWASGARERWGMVYRSSRRFAFTRPVRRANDRHPIESHLALLETCGVPVPALCNEFRLPAAAAVEADRFLQQHQLDPRRSLIFIQAFTSSPGKNWPLERYLELARAWHQQRYQVLFGGGPGDREALAPALKAGFPVSAGVPLLVTAGLLARSNLVLGGDTGVVHLGVALGKRVVMIMSGTWPGSSPPFQHEDWAVTPTSGQNLERITLPAVREACARALGDFKGELRQPG